MIRITMVMLLGMIVSAPVMRSAGSAPILFEDVELLASDGNAKDRFGNAVALDGDVLVISRNNASEPHEEGAAYVLERDSEGTWVEVAILSDPDPDDIDYFGYSAAVDGDLIVVGATIDNERTVEGGAAYVFERQPTGAWVASGKLFGSGATDSTTFGYSVGVSRETVVVGARQHDQLGKNAGAAFVFERTEAGTWFEAAKLLASDGREEDHLGTAVAIEGDTIVVGATGVDDQGSASGAAYVFERLDGVWTETAKLLASDCHTGCNVGFSVTVDGDIVALGAPGQDDQGPSSGAAYVFRRDAGGGWRQTAKLLSPDGRGFDKFAWVSVDGDSLVVGSNAGKTAPGVNSGTADLFRLLGGTTWAHVARLFPSDAGNLDQFGEVLAIDGDAVAIGARLHDHLGQDSGSVYVYSLTEARIDLRLGTSAIRAGEDLRVEIRMESRNAETAPGTLHLWIEDAAGVVVASRRTPLTWRQGHELRREEVLRIPEGTPPGEYRVLGGVERMRLGLAAAGRSFRVVAGPSAQAPAR